jgi:protein SCO1/2
MVRQAHHERPVVLSLSKDASTVSSVVAIFVSLVSFVVSPPQAAAQMTTAPAGAYRRDPGVPSSVVPKPLREVGFDQNLNQQIPLDVPFADEQGRRVRLGDYFDGRPVVLALVYYDCPMLCTQVLNSLAGALGVLSLEPHKDFEIVTVSFDPREKPPLAAAKKATYLERYRHAGAEAGWHFLTGDRGSIDRLTKAVGFRYVWDESLKQFAHPTGIMVLTPKGRLARYLFGVEYWPRDLRFALIDASAGRIGSPAEKVLLYCYHYDPEAGRYGFVVLRAVRIAAGLTVLALGTFICVMVRRERRPPIAAPPADAAGIR